MAKRFNNEVEIIDLSELEEQTKRARANTFSGWSSNAQLTLNFDVINESKWRTLVRPYSCELDVQSIDSRLSNMRMTNIQRATTWNDVVLNDKRMKPSSVQCNEGSSIITTSTKDQLDVEIKADERPPMLMNDDSIVDVTLLVPSALVLDIATKDRLSMEIKAKEGSAITTPVKNQLNIEIEAKGTSIITTSTKDQLDVEIKADERSPKAKEGSAITTPVKDQLNIEIEVNGSSIINTSTKDQLDVEIKADERSPKAKEGSAITTPVKDQLNTEIEAKDSLAVTTPSEEYLEMVRFIENDFKWMMLGYYWDLTPRMETEAKERPIEIVSQDQRNKAIISSTMSEQLEKQMNKIVKERSTITTPMEDQIPTDNDFFEEDEYFEEAMVDDSDESNVDSIDIIDVFDDDIIEVNDFTDDESDDFTDDFIDDDDDDDDNDNDDNDDNDDDDNDCEFIDDDDDDFVEMDYDFIDDAMWQIPKLENPNIVTKNQKKTKIEAKERPTEVLTLLRNTKIKESTKVTPTGFYYYDTTPTVRRHVRTLKSSLIKLLNMEFKTKKLTTPLEDHQDLEIARQNAIRDTLKKMADRNIKKVKEEIKTIEELIMTAPTKDELDIKNEAKDKQIQNLKKEIEIFKEELLLDNSVFETEEELTMKDQPKTELIKIGNNEESITSIKDLDMEIEAKDKQVQNLQKEIEIFEELSVNQPDLKIEVNKESTTATKDQLNLKIEAKEGSVITASTKDQRNMKIFAKDRHLPSSKRGTEMLEQFFETELGLESETEEELTMKDQPKTELIKIGNNEESITSIKDLDMEIEAKDKQVQNLQKEIEIFEESSINQPNLKIEVNKESTTATKDQLNLNIEVEGESVITAPTKKQLNMKINAKNRHIPSSKRDIEMLEDFMESLLESESEDELNPRLTAKDRLKRKLGIKIRINEESITPIKDLDMEIEKKFTSRLTYPAEVASTFLKKRSNHSVKFMMPNESEKLTHNSENKEPEQRQRAKKPTNKDSELLKWTNKLKEDYRKIEFCWPKLSKNCRMFFGYFMISLLYLVLLLSITFAIMENGKDHKHSSDFENAVTELNQQIYGQDEAISDLSEYLLLDEPSSKIIILVGGTGVGKSHTVEIIKKNFPRKYAIQKYVPPIGAANSIFKYPFIRENLIIMENLRESDLMDVVNYLKVHQDMYKKRMVTVLAVFNFNQVDDHLLQSTNVYQVLYEVEKAFHNEKVNAKVIPYVSLDKYALKKCIVDEARKSNLWLNKFEIDFITRSLLKGKLGCKGAYDMVQLIGREHSSLHGLDLDH